MAWPISAAPTFVRSSWCTATGTPSLPSRLLPASITATAASGPGTATIDTFISSPTSPATLPGNGKLTVFVGATLNVGVGQAPETYTGTFEIIVIYP